MRFEFATAGRIVFGAGTLREAGDIAAALGRRPLLITGRTPERASPLLALLRERDLRPATFTVMHEPEVAMMRSGAAFARERRCDSVIGFGGGAVIDAAKAIAILATNGGDVLDYLEIIGDGRSLTEPALAALAIPTTAGTGSEVTRNSVIASRDERVKVSLRSPMMLLRVALVDPELTYDLPPAVTATTGTDALTQLIEPFVCTRANALTDGLCREGIPRVARSLRRAVENGGDTVAREDMAAASLFGGLALANAGLGAVHGLAGPVGGMVAAPHGAVCAALLPHVVRANVTALRERDRDGSALTRYQEVARLLTADPAATIDEAIAWLDSLVHDLEIPGLAAYGLLAADIPELVEKAARASSMKGNPVELTPDELAAIVQSAI